MRTRRGFVALFKDDGQGFYAVAIDAIEVPDARQRLRCFVNDGRVPGVEGFQDDDWLLYPAPILGDKP